MNDYIHDSKSRTQSAREIEARPGHSANTWSTLHDKLHKLGHPDSDHGVLHSTSVKHDVHSLENKLRQDGYLPDLHIVMPDRDQNSDRSTPGFDAIKHDGEFKELRLHNRAEHHAGADALVYVRKDFDAGKPVHLVIYNHGLGSTVGSALERTQIKDMMSKAQANTILVLPEWQARPGTRDGNSGTFAEQDKFTHMVEEIMEKTPALHGATLRNVDRIDIIAHSAGYSPTEAEIYKNSALSEKIHSITLLDSLYDKHGFDKWLGDNINDLSTGGKKFFNFSNSSTSENSREEAKLVASLLRHKELPANNYVADYGSGKGHIERHAGDMAKRSIVFASTTTGHYEIPGQYIGPALAALNPERDQKSD